MPVYLINIHLLLAYDVTSDFFLIRSQTIKKNSNHFFWGGGLDNIERRFEQEQELFVWDRYIYDENIWIVQVLAHCFREKRFKTERCILKMREKVNITYFHILGIWIKMKIL